MCYTWFALQSSRGRLLHLLYTSHQQLDLIFDLEDRKLSQGDQKWKFWMIIEVLNM